MPRLSDRLNEILRAIVAIYVENAEPVGSRTISKRAKLGLSPATIRSAMADLEEQGLLKQPHTSAGRLPTRAGIKYYVNNLLTKNDVPLMAQDVIERSLTGQSGSLSDLLKKTVELLATFSGHAAIASTPRANKKAISHMEFIRLSPGEVLLIAFSESGIIQDLTTRMPCDLSEKRLHSIENYINNMLETMDLEEAREAIQKDMDKDWRMLASILGNVISSNAGMTDIQDILISGRPNLLDQPEFSNLERLKGLLMAMEEKSSLLMMLDLCLKAPGVQVIIGTDKLGCSGSNCSLILVSYDRDDQPVGSLGVIGPMRMNYAHVIPLVEYTQKILSECLKEL
jgi:heat-inducible transcriptional repressor